MPFNLSTFDAEFSPEEIGHGSYGIAYRVSKNHAAKVLYKKSLDGSVRLRGDETAVLDLSRECDITRTLYDNGINVPQPVGIFRLPLGDISTPAFVMEFINGKNALELADPEYSEAMRLAEGEMKKARTLGFLTADTSARNVLWNAAIEKSYLIDFAMWDKSYPWEDC